MHHRESERERVERVESERRDEEETRLIVRSDPEIKNMMKRRKVAAAAAAAAAARRRGRSGARNRLLGKTIASRISRLCCMEYVALLSCP